MKKFFEKFFVILLAFVSLIPFVSLGSGGNFGINMDVNSMKDWTATFSINEALGLGKKNNDPVFFLQDVVLWASLFIWTVVTVALIVSWLLYIFSWASSSLKSKAQNWMKYSLIGMVIVMSSFIIIRMVQFLAKGWS